MTNIELFIIWFIVYLLALVIIFILQSIDKEDKLREKKVRLLKKKIKELIYEKD